MLNEAEYVCLARLLLAQGKSDEALRLLGRLLRSAESAGRVRRVIEVLVLQARALADRQSGDQATRALARALTLAEPEGYVRLFVDEGEPLARLLDRIRRLGDGNLAGYANGLLAAFGHQVYSEIHWPTPCGKHGGRVGI